MTHPDFDSTVETLFSEALALADRIDDSEIRSGTLTSIGVDLFQSGREEKALRILCEMKNPKHRSVLLWDFTLWCAWHDRFEDMEQFRSQLKKEQRDGTATPFGDPSFFDTQIERILADKNENPPAKAERSEADTSEPIAISFDDPVEEWIHNAHLSKHDLDVARKKLRKAFDILRTDRRSTERRIRQLESVLYAFVEFHDPDSALEVQEEIERSIRNTEFDTVITSGGLRHEAMKVIIAQSYANENRIAEALALAREIENIPWRATTLSAVAKIAEAKRRNAGFDITESM